MPVLIRRFDDGQTGMSVLLVWITPEDYTLRQVVRNNTMSDRLQLVVTPQRINCGVDLAPTLCIEPSVPLDKLKLIGLIRQTGAARRPFLEH